jgi:RimJ/RimL family protein N-acetyltransferase
VKPAGATMAEKPSAACAVAKASELSPACPADRLLAMSTLPIQLPTARLLIRDYLPEDCGQAAEIAADPEVVRYVRWGPNDRAATEAFIRSAMDEALHQPRRNYTLAVACRDKGTIVGGCSLEIRRPHDREGQMGYHLGRPYWGSGYATEIAAGLLDFGFRTLGLHRISATADVRNTASWRVMEKVGMVREGRLRRHMSQRGEWRDSYLYSILEDDYQDDLPQA